MVSGPGPGGLDGDYDALGAAGGKAATCAVGGGEHFEEGVEELAFVLDEAGEEVGSEEGVVVYVHLIGVVGDLNDVFTAEVAAALELPGCVPGFVLLSVSGGHLGLDVGPGSGGLVGSGVGSWVSGLLV